MRMKRSLLLSMALLLFVMCVNAQTGETTHFAKDGLSFDYPANWQLSDQSTGQMQFIQLMRDGFAEIRIRVPREWLKSPAKEAEAKKLIQDEYVNAFFKNLEDAGLHPKRSDVTTQIAGGEARGVRIRAILDGDPGGMDSYARVVSDRFVNLSALGSEKEMQRSAPLWDLIRNSLALEPPPVPKSSPKPGKP